MSESPGFSTIGAPYWDDAPVVIVASGPSVFGIDFEACFRPSCHVLAVKGAMFELPWAEAGFGLDLPRLNEWLPRLGALPMPVWWAIPEERVKRYAEGPPNLHLLKRSRQDSIVGMPADSIAIGGTSGHGALHFAVHKRARQIFLYGFDHKPKAGAGWHHRSHHRDVPIQYSLRWREWAQRFEKTAGEMASLGIEVLNVSPDSAVEAFRKVTHAEAMECLHRLGFAGGDSVGGGARLDPVAPD